jgi:hypothetical protein
MSDHGHPHGKHGHGHGHAAGGHEHGRDRHGNPEDFDHYLAKLEDPERVAWQQPDAVVADHLADPVGWQLEERHKSHRDNK